MIDLVIVVWVEPQFFGHIPVRSCNSCHLDTPPSITNVRWQPPEESFFWAPCHLARTKVTTVCRTSVADLLLPWQTKSPVYLSRCGWGALRKSTHLLRCLSQWCRFGLLVIYPLGEYHRAEWLADKVAWMSLLG
jgi:hypothetical protein